MDITLGMFDADGKLIVDEDYPVFVDWSNEFNKDTAGQAETIYVPVSYTHLDVYKRQPLSPLTPVM